MPRNAHPLRLRRSLYCFWPLLIVFLASSGILHVAAQGGGQGSGQAPTPPAASFVGSGRCASCHGSEATAWKTSQHARALQQAQDGTVLGRFDGATFEKDGVVTRFERSGNRYLIETEGGDGKRGTFEVRFTLGLAPLQQYLVEAPGGRLQAFGIAWDSRPASAGGQRWFDLYPGQRLAPGDPLHWTGIQQTANFMCIDCHVTGFNKGFDAQANAYRSTWSEAGVGCEACHGPGSAHAANPKQAKLAAKFPSRSQNIWGTDPAHRPQVATEGRLAEVESCARCHARRSQLADAVNAGDRFGDGFRAALLEPGLYHADGQMQDEVFNYGSFLQSRMFAKGVSCGDCHDPHSQKLRADGNAVCSQCHEAARYETATHHFHEPESKAGQCVSCHMPAVDFMVVDPRHDHSFRLPRPDLSAKTGVPDVCTTCHAGRTPEWAVEELSRRKGAVHPGFQTFGGAFANAERGGPGAAAQLAAVVHDPEQPAIVRASALMRLAALEPSLRGVDLKRALTDSDPLVRRSAAEAAGNGGDPAIWRSELAQLARDPVREVRIAAARALAGPAELGLSDDERSAFRRALDDYIEVQRFNADRAEGHLNLALLEIRRGNGLLADDHLARAIAVDPTFVPSYLQLADLKRGRGDEAGAEAVLRRTLERNRDSAEAHFALGLSLVRQRKMPEAIEELRRAHETEPGSAEYGYVYAVALDQSGRASEAKAMLDQVLAAHPNDLSALVAAASWAMRGGRRSETLQYLRRIQTLRPDDPAIARQIQMLETPR